MANFKIEAKAKMNAGHKVIQAMGIAGFNHIHADHESITFTIDEALAPGTHTITLKPVVGHGDGMTLTGTIS
jgi:hypothetical protein